MQYGVKIDNYKRVKDSENVKNNMKIEASSIGLIMAMVAGLLISRVYLDMTFGVVQVLAPFGLAYLIAITNYEKKYILSSSLGVIVGYITLFNKVNNFSAYIIISTIVTIISMSKLNKYSKFYNCIFRIIYLWSFSRKFRYNFTLYRCYFSNSLSFSYILCCQLHIKMYRRNKYSTFFLNR